MVPRTALCVGVAWTLAFVAVAGCVAVPGAEGDPSALSSPPEIGRAEWSGHIVASATDPLLHTAPTDAILWPQEQAGVIFEISEGVTAIEVAVAWTGEGTFGLHLHSHDPGGDPVGHRSAAEQWSENPHCIRVPPADVASGHWMAMIHSDGAMEDDFTITILTENAKPTVLDERHGHDRASDLTDDESRDERSGEACTIWSPASEA